MTIVRGRLNRAAKAGRLLLVLLAGLCLASAAMAVPVRPGERRDDPAARIAAEVADYGAWLGRLQAVEAPIEGQLTGLGPAWQAAQAAGGGDAEVAARLRPIVSRMLAEIDRALPAIDALDRPVFPGMDLPDDLQPAAILHDVQALNRQIRDAFAAFNPLFDAMAANDRRASEAAATHLLASFGLVLDSQVLLARATLAATPSDDPSRVFGSIDLLFARSGARMFRAWRPFEPPQVDSALPGDLVALADELDTNAAQGRPRIEADLATYRENLAAAERRGDHALANINRRALAIFEAGLDYFPMSQALASMLRAEADRVRGHAVTEHVITDYFGQLRPMRLRMGEIQRRMIAAMAAQ